MYKATIKLLCILILNTTTLHAIAVSPDELDLLGSYGSEELVSIAAGYQQPITKAPGIATVITAKDIKSIGARDLNEVLETVPGLHVTMSTTYSPIFVMRGIYSEYNPQVLFMMNGVPITNFLFGNRGQVWGGMLLENIARIEIMRSPGSAIYGADAVAGVVNIITKSADDINGTTVGGQIGSYNHRQAWIQHGGNYGGWNTAISLQVQTTDGQQQIVTADAQSTFDSFFVTSASLAPGAVNTGRDLIEASVDLSKGNWRGRFNYQGRNNIETGAGLAQALDPGGSAEDDRFLVDLNYSNTDFHPDWDLDATLSYFNASNKSSLYLFPAGSDFTAGGGGGPFPDGVRGIPGVKEQHIRFESSGLFTGLDKHAIRLGIGYHNGDMYEVTESRNYSLNGAGFPIPLGGGLTDVSDTAAFVKESKRTIYFTYIQDEWKFSPDWALTTGLRYDDYSDFGTTVNPRLALVWQTTYNLTSKLLYNRAFRPPSFAEQFNINNPIALGNPNLEPETIDTFELAFNYRVTEKLSSNLTLFHYELTDIIRFVPDPAPLTSKMAQNTTGQNGYGLEWEMKWNLNRDIDLTANYALQQSEDRSDSINTGIAPEQQLYIRGDWRFIELWSMNAQLNHVHGRTREAKDTRPAIDNYTIIDLTLRRAAAHKGIEYAISIRNLLDSGAYEPSPSPGLIPNDLPLAGRNAFVEVRYNW
ncbi:MAG: TonB-dependent receptor plug domain-containing protein [Gammaproteobacteria bacterium]